MRGQTFLAKLTSNVGEDFPEKHPFFSVFPKLGGTFLAKLILTLFFWEGGREQNEKNCPNCVQTGRG